MGGPLEGIKVVEMGVWVAGPAAGGILSDWGADVVKIEPPGLGDPARMFQYMLGGDLPYNPVFENDNRSKRSIVADLRKPEGLEIALDLIREADVFVTNVRPAGLARLGLSAEALCALPAADLRADHRLRHRRTGGRPRRLRHRRLLGALRDRPLARGARQPPPHQRGMGDHNAGLAAAGGICAALFNREKTGRGADRVDVAAARRALHALLRSGGRASLRPVDPGRQPQDGRQSRDQQLRRLRGQLLLDRRARGERHWPPLARAASHPEWIEDPHFADPRSRAENAEALIAMLDEIFATKTRAEWGEIFDAEEDLWWAPVQSIDDVIADPQVAAAGASARSRTATTTTLPASPVDFHGTPWAPRAMAPAHGEHTEQVLREIGRTGSDIASLREKGIVV